MADETKPADVVRNRERHCACCGATDIATVSHRSDDGGVDVVCLSCRSEYSVYFDGCALLDTSKERDMLREVNANLRKSLDRELRYTASYCIAGNGAKGERCTRAAGHDGNHDYGKLDSEELARLRKLVRDLFSVLDEIGVRGRT
jgi:hypothetical protein